MLFILSKNITVKRKIFYYGLMFSTISIVLIAMLALNPEDQKELYRWAAVAFVVGVSLIAVTVLSPSIIASKDRWGSIAYFVYAFMIPVFICIIAYVIFILISRESVGEQYFIYNLNRIILLSAPCILLAEFLLYKFKGAD